MTKLFCTSITVLGTLLMGSSAIRADIIARDSFATDLTGDSEKGIYEEGADLAGEANRSVHGGSIVGFGSHNWVGNTGLIVASAAGLAAKGAGYATGGAARYKGHGDDTIRAVRRALNKYEASSTYFVSMLMRAEVVETEGAAYGGFNCCADAFEYPDVTYGIFFGFAGNGDGMDLVVRQRTNIGGETFALADKVLAPAAANTTYHLVARIDVDAGGKKEMVTVWLNPVDQSDAPLVTLGFEDNIYSMPSADSISVVTVSARHFNGGVVFDEMRIGTDWADVVAPE